MLKSSREKADCCSLHQLQKQIMWEAQHLNEGKDLGTLGKTNNLRRKISLAKTKDKSLRVEVDRVTGVIRIRNIRLPPPKKTLSVSNG